MTGFAALDAGNEGQRRRWEMRSVNGRGLDLRLRMPDGYEAAEPRLRAAVSKALARGNVSLTLRQSRDAGVPAPVFNPAAADAAIAALAEVQARATAAGIDLAVPSGAEVLGLRGVWDVAAAEQTGDVPEDLDAEVAGLVAALVDARRQEGRALGAIISGQIDQIATLLDAAIVLAEARKEEIAQNFRAALERVLENADRIDEARLSQDIAALVVKADITEELDRLAAHIAAARALLAAKGPVGRKFDFLVQEFNREANTLCSKSGMAELTRIGLDLKTVIDQMREQVQNVE